MYTNIRVVENYISKKKYNAFILINLNLNYLLSKKGGLCDNIITHTNNIQWWTGDSTGWLFDKWLKDSLGRCDTNIGFSSLPIFKSRKLIKMTHVKGKQKPWGIEWTSKGARPSQYDVDVRTYI